MPINPYLVFNGNTREALTFYTEVFQEEMPEIMEFGPGPGPDGQPYPPEHQTLILHYRPWHTSHVLRRDATKPCDVRTKHYVSPSLSRCGAIARNVRAAR